jgi:hypothetical protein
MNIIYIDKCWYEILEQEEVTVWHTGTYRPILSTVKNNELIMAMIMHRLRREMQANVVLPSPVN